MPAMPQSVHPKALIDLSTRAGFHVRPVRPYLRTAIMKSLGKRSRAVPSARGG